MSSVLYAGLGRAGRPPESDYRDLVASLEWMRPIGLLSVPTTTTGVVIGTYEPAGEIVTGSFALD